MRRSEPSLQEWRELYEAAVEFKELEPWLWMSDSDLFVVINPETGEMGFCSVIGALGEEMGMILFPGIEGLRSLLFMRRSQLDQDEKEMLRMAVQMRNISLSFEDRSDLSSRDLKLIKELGLKFRGRKQWPMFRSMSPGYDMWFLNAEEARFMNHALRQAIDVSRRFKDDPDMLFNPEDESLILARTPGEEDGKITWKDEWIEPPDIAEVGRISYEIAVPVEIMMRLKQLDVAEDMRWEVDSIIPPFTVRDETGRPAFPHVFMGVDTTSHLPVIAPGIATGHPFNDIPVKFVEWVIDGFLNVGMIPGEIHIDNDFLLPPLKLLANELGFRIRRVESLEALNQMSRALFSFMEGKDQESV